MGWLPTRFFRKRRIDLQAKILLVLIAVILPTYLLVTLLVSQIAAPLFEQELRQVGINTAKNLATEIRTGRLLSTDPPASQLIENRIQELLYEQPNILEIDVLKLKENGEQFIVASNMEQKPEDEQLAVPIGEELVSTYKKNGAGDDIWEIVQPLKFKGKIIGAIREEVSLKTVASLGAAFWKITFVAAALNVIVLILALSYFLRKTIASERLLLRTESENLALAEKLRDAERQLMMNEKFAVMGQLTASFAHEIGTPLNAVNGHLQLLEEDLKAVSAKGAWNERFAIITGQLLKIENIVKGFLQSTAKPSSQKQLLDLNNVLEKTLAIVRPRVDSMGVRLKVDMDRSLRPLRAVPLDLEQILLNLLNNALDSMQSRQRLDPSAKLVLSLTSKEKAEHLRSWSEISVHDTGQGISKANLAKVFQPFFTTKQIGEGTGLGLTICQQIASRYGGEIMIDSKEGAWTQVILRLPYGGGA